MKNNNLKKESKYFVVRQNDIAKRLILEHGFLDNLITYTHDKYDPKCKSWIFLKDKEGKLVDCFFNIKREMERERRWSNDFNFEKRS